MISQIPMTRIGIYSVSCKKKTVPCVFYFLPLYTVPTAGFFCPYFSSSSFTISDRDFAFFSRFFISIYAPNSGEGPISEANVPIPWFQTNMEKSSSNSSAATPAAYSFTGQKGHSRAVYAQSSGLRIIPLQLRSFLPLPGSSAESFPLAP